MGKFSYYKRKYNGSDATSTGRAMRSWGQQIGSHFGSSYGPYGSSIGGMLGKGLGAGLSMITGNGDYIVHNSLLKGGCGGGQVSFGNGRIRITHREYIQDIQSSVGFQISQLELNPGLPSTFPFLSQLASNFETYEMHGLVFEYRPTSADALNSTNTALGVVVMAVQYNCLNSPFVSKQQMEAYEGAVSVRPSAGMICGVECAKGGLPLKDLYVRNGSVPSGQDERFYDMGEFNLATQGMQAVSDIGELWVSYDITLKYPKLSTAIGGNNTWLHMYATTSISTSDYFGSYTDTSGTLEIYAGNTTLRFANSGTDPLLTNGFEYPTAGNYLIQYVVRGGSTTVTAPLISAGSAFSALKLYGGETYNSLRQLTDTNSVVSATYTFTYQPDFVTEANNTLTFSGATLPSTPGYMDCWIFQIDSAITSSS